MRLYYIAFLSIYIGILNCSGQNSDGTYSPKKEQIIEGPCELEPCHGLDLSCSLRPPQMCTEEYLLGDFCRKFALCAPHNGQCALLRDPNFYLCKACVEACVGSADEAFACEEKCREEIQ
jgi:hypothetical protein